MDFYFRKKERLCSKIIIEKLFNEGKVIYEYPLKALWLSISLPEDVPVQAVISVSKRRFKRAVKRNILKRRMRESYRLNKNPFYKQMISLDKQIALMVLYNNNTPFDFHIIQNGMIKLFDKILLKLKEIESTSKTIIK